MTAVVECSPTDLAVAGRLLAPLDPVVDPEPRAPRLPTVPHLVDVGAEDALIGELSLTDDELAAQALAADLDQPIDDDAPPWSPTSTALMPDWYMPASLPRHRGGWRAWVAVAVIVGLVAINGAGLCITYGHLVIA